MDLAAPPSRKTRVGGRSRRNGGFWPGEQLLSPILHRGCNRPSYGFAPGNFYPKIDFIEIGAAGSAADPATVARVKAAAEKATKDTAKPKPKTPPLAKRNVWGNYVDELVSYTVKKPRKSPTRYYAHSNHLYSVAAVTSATGSVVERWSYNAYGVPTIKNSAGATLAKSGVGQTRGFTGYTLDSETGLYAARARMYSAKTGRFISRNSYLKIFAPTYSVLPWDTFSLVPMRATRVFAGVDYVDGFGLYSGLFAMVQGLDPSGEPGPLALVIGGFSLGEIIGAGLVAGGTVAVVDAKGAVQSGYWWIAVFPCFALVLISLAINFIGDALRDATDPRLDRGE